MHHLPRKGFNLMERFKTFLSVALLSCMIWYFCEQKVKQSAQVTVKLQFAANDQIDMSFISRYGQDWGTTPLTRQLTVEGPAGLLKSVKGGAVVFEIDPALLFSEQERKELGDHSIDVVKRLLGHELTIHGSTITVVEAEPAEVIIRIFPLIEKTVNVVVYDETGESIITGIESIEPKEVRAYVRVADQAPEAVIKLTAQERLKAIKAPISVKCDVNNKPYALPILIKLFADKSHELATDKVTKPRLMVVFPYLTLNKYKVVIDSDESDWKDLVINVRGSNEAVAAFINPEVTPHHFILEIKEADVPDVSYDRQLKYTTDAFGDDLGIIDQLDILVKFHLELIPVVKKKSDAL